MPYLLGHGKHATLELDEVLADQVWELWDRGLISDDLAAVAWCILAATSRQQIRRCHHE